MKKRILKVIVFTICLSVILSTTVSASIGQTNYVIDNRGKVSIPVCYIPDKRIESVYEGSYINAPKNIYVDNEDNLYFADSGNNRIVKLNSNLEFVAEFSATGTLEQPSGAFYNKEDNSLYIA